MPLMAEDSSSSRDLGMPAQEFRKDLAQRELRDLHGDRDADDPAGLRHALAHRLFGDLCALQQRHRVLVELGAQVGHAELA